MLGSLWVGLLAARLRPVHLGRAIGAVGLCLLPVGLAFLLPLGTLGRYGVLVAGFCLCQFGCSFFSTYAIAAIQGRTPAGLMGKVMSCVYTISLCASPWGSWCTGPCLTGLPARCSGCSSPRLWWCVPWVWPPGASSSGGRDRHRQRDKSKICPLKCNI